MKARRIRVGEREFFFRVLHEHGPRADGRGYEGCRDLLTLRSDAPRSAPLRLVFEAGPGRLVGDGFNATGHLLWWVEEHRRLVPPGTVLATRESPASLNLHQPGVARAFLDEALARGWDGVAREELDGWSLFEAVHARLGNRESVTQPRRARRD